MEPAIRMRWRRTLVLLSYAVLSGAPAFSTVFEWPPSRSWLYSGPQSTGERIFLIDSQESASIEIKLRQALEATPCRPAAAGGDATVFIQCDLAWICRNADANAAIGAVQRVIPITETQAEAVEPWQRDYLEQTELDIARRVPPIEDEISQIATNPKLSAICALTATAREVYRRKARMQSDALQSVTLRFQFKAGHSSDGSSARPAPRCRNYVIADHDRPLDDGGKVCGRSWPPGLWTKTLFGELRCIASDHDAYDLGNRSDTNEGTLARIAEGFGGRVVHDCTKFSPTGNQSFCRAQRKQLDIILPADRIQAFLSTLRSNGTATHYALSEYDQDTLELIQLERTHLQEFGSSELTHVRTLVDAIGGMQGAVRKPMAHAKLMWCPMGWTHKPEDTAAPVPDFMKGTPRR